MHKHFFFDELQTLFEHTLENHQCGAITDSNGDPIYVKYQNLPDIGTLPRSAQMAVQYLNLNDRDLVLTNDPYSGGTILSTMTLIGLLDLSRINKSFPKVMISTRITFKPEIQISNTIEEEGLRIPPTPIKQKNQINDPILEAISSHPMAPPTFKQTLLNEVEKLEESLHRLFTSVKTFQFDFSKSTLSEYYDATNEIFIEFLSQLPKGEIKKNFIYEHDSKVQLLLNVKVNQVIFDFTGTGTSQSIGLTDTATFGACLGALLAAFKNPLPLNQGVFRSIQVIAPKKSMVNTQYPTPTYHGMSDGAPLLANSVIQCLLALGAESEMADSGVTLCSIDIDFGESHHFFDTLEAGTGALNKFPGRNGLNLWRRSHLEPSVEQIEKRFALHIKSFSYRQKSGGAGLYEGGQGVSKVYKLLAPAKLKWMISQDVHAPAGVAGGKHGAGAQIYIQKKGNFKNKVGLPACGSYDLEKDDVLVVLSPGGGGFGEA
ncbi:MAG: hydantoinase B/oxoprolinase family protein [Bdellovibrionales bacterium]|nr:hydantoinase B/oxoprolinase family protein [Bdellovibrionales bacterium]